MRHTLSVLVFVLLLRAPFLNQAIQGDDVNYLTAAQYAQTDPAHPGHVWFVFQGKKVTMQGHPHPPFNAWFLAGLLALTGDIKEVPYHAAYMVFSVIAALAALSLARRFTDKPLAATLLFLVTPAFVVNGTSLESDVPLTAFWLAVTALYVKAVDGRSWRWLAAAGAMMVLLAMSAFQSVVIVPVLALYLWKERRDWRPGWAVLLVVPAVLGGWQLFEKLTSEQLPAALLAGYLENLQTVENKLRNAAGLTAHLGAVVFPALSLAFFWQAIAGWVAALAIDPHPLFAIPFCGGLAVLVYCARRWREFLAQWVLVFFAAALVLFFAGSARYLLPLALPVALMASRMKRAWVIGAIGAQLVVSLAMATVNYQHWDGYRQLVKRYEPDWRTKRVWINSEFGLRFYAESVGGLPLEQGQAVRPGDVVVTSLLGYPVTFHTGGGVLAPVAEVAIGSAMPVRLFGLGARSAYSTASKGFRHFDWGTGPMDVVKVETVVERKPELSYLPMNAPQAASQIVSGLDRLEDGRYRWMGRRAVLLLKRPEQTGRLEVDLFIPDAAPARRVMVTLDGVRVAEVTYPGPGAQKLVTGPVTVSGESATLVIEVDRTFAVPGDQRELGMILAGAGFR